MNEREFWDSYNASQTKIKISDDLKRKIIEETQNTSKNNSSNHPINAPIDVAQNTVTPRRRTPRFVLPLAACLAILAISFGIAVSTFGGNPSEGTGDVASDFMVQAYAAGTDTILEVGNDNQIIFSRAPSMYGIGDKQAYLSNEGYYTGCLFRVEGDDITRIQASVSTGVIYRTTYEQVNITKDAEKWRELAHWKPQARGLGEYYGNYDDVERMPMDDGLPKDSPDKTCTVALTKKLGSTIDVPVKGDSSACSFGFWTNEDYGDVTDAIEATDAVIDLFDGATLTVTATFADGHTTTQVIELHSADVKASQEQDSDGVWHTVLSPEIVDPATNTNLVKYYDYIRTLYGVVKETSHEPFPGSLDNANELENIVTDPYPFERQPLTRPLMHEQDGQLVNVPFDPAIMHPATDSLTMPSYSDPSAGSSFEIENIKMLHRGKTLPDGLTLNDLRSGMGSWEYYNRVTSQIDGYTLDENGTPSDGFSWVMMESALTNTSDTAQEITADGGFYGQIAIVDDSGNISTAFTRTFALLKDGWDAPKSGVYADILLDPQETTTVRWMTIVPDFILDDPSLFYLAGGSGSLAGVELPLPN